MCFGLTLPTSLPDPVACLVPEAIFLNCPTLRQLLVMMQTPLVAWHRHAVKLPQGRNHEDSSLPLNPGLSYGSCRGHREMGAVTGHKARLPDPAQGHKEQAKVLVGMFQEGLCMRGFGDLAMSLAGLSARSAQEAPNHKGS